MSECLINEVCLLNHLQVSLSLLLSLLIPSGMSICFIEQCCQLPLAIHVFVIQQTIINIDVTGFNLHGGNILIPILIACLLCGLPHWGIPCTSTTMINLESLPIGLMGTNDNALIRYEVHWHLITNHVLLALVHLD